MITSLYTPTHVLLGEGAEEKAGDELRKEGAKKVLIHYGSERVVTTGLMKKVTDQLDNEGISYMLLGGVKPNPRVSLVREGIALAEKEDVDFILAVGGGSVIDSAKAIAYGLYDKTGGCLGFLFRSKSATGIIPDRRNPHTRSNRLRDERQLRHNERRGKSKERLQHRLLPSSLCSPES